MNKQKFIEALKDGVVSVTFNKVSGSVRTMNVTLNEDVLPEREETLKPSRAQNNDVCNVWSVNDNGWRSFRWDSVIEWTAGE